MTLKIENGLVIQKCNCAHMILTAGTFKNDISNTSVPGNSVGNNVTTNSELPLETSKLSPIKEDAHVPSVLSESNKPVTLEAPNENIPSNDSMTALPTIKSTTTSTIETKPISTTSTSKPTTTSTSTSKPTTSTPKPTTTPIPSTTIPVPTTLLPPPSTGTWHIRQDNKLCIMIQMAAQFNVSYNNATMVSILIVIYMYISKFNISVSEITLSPCASIYSINVISVLSFHSHSTKKWIYPLIVMQQEIVVNLNKL